MGAYRRDVNHYRAVLEQRNEVTRLARGGRGVAALVHHQAKYNSRYCAESLGSSLDSFHRDALTSDRFLSLSPWEHIPSVFNLTNINPLPYDLPLIERSEI